MAKYTKAIIAFFTLLGTWGATAYADDAITNVELFGLCGVIVGTFSVFQFPNAEAVYMKRDATGKFVTKD